MNSDPRMNATTYFVQGLVAQVQGDLAKAKRYISLSIENSKALNDRSGIVSGQSALAHILRREGNFDEAVA